MLSSSASAGNLPEPRSVLAINGSYSLETKIFQDLERRDHTLEALRVTFPSSEGLTEATVAMSDRISAPDEGIGRHAKALAFELILIGCFLALRAYCNRKAKPKP